MFKIKRKYFLIVFIFILLFKAGQAWALQFSPVIKKPELNPGEEIMDQIKLHNDLGREVEYKIEVLTFKASENGKDPDFSQTLNQKNSNFLSWIELSETGIKLEKNASAIIDYKIKIPEDAGAGGYYFAILFSEKGLGNEDIIISGKTGPIFLLKVNGEINYDYSLKEFKANLQEQKIKIKFDYKVNNKSNIHVVPSGVIIIRSLGITGFKEIGRVKLNQNQKNILPDSERILKEEFKFPRDKFLPLGFYKFELILNNDNLEKKAATETIFISSELIKIVISIIVLQFIIIALITYLKKKNKYKY
ncbi:MAG: DUF916 domain-containing protein [Candidatus Moranbacteria bacterium]|nr:DUF916 domain-containing protein [Candidatus Moranbacteria bacterium]